MCVLLAHPPPGLRAGDIVAFMGFRSTRGLVAGLLALAAASGPAAAEVDRIVLVDVPANVEAAVRATLEPWHVELIVVHGPTPGPSMPSSAEKAHAISQRHDAGAAAWIADDGSGSALWIFDGESDRTVARRLASPPPYDDPTAAAVALSIKTLLRFSAVAPPVERLAPDEREPAPVAATPDAADRVVLVVRSGLRRRDTGVGAYEPRIGLGARVRVPAFGLDLALDGGVRLGSGETLAGPTYAGHFEDVALVGRLGLDLGRGRLHLLPMVGGGLHLTSVDGTLFPSGLDAGRSRLNPSLDAGLLAALELSHGVEVGLELEGAWILRRQRYRVEGAEIFDLPAAEAEVSVVVGAAVF
jgi:hypothetical protein